MSTHEIPEAAVDAVVEVLWDKEVSAGDVRAALEAACPILAAQVLRDAVEAFPLETITAPDNAVMWLTRRAEQIEATL